MSRYLAKRKRAAPTLVPDELTILNLIQSKKGLGIWVRHIKFETKLTNNVVTKSLKSLLSKNLIKEVKNIQNKSGKHYMGVEFEPSREISGGDFYTDGHLDEELINELKHFFLRYVRRHKVATVEGLHRELKKHGVVKFDISSEQVAQIFYLMVLENDIIEVKSTGLGDFHSIPIGTMCYRVGSGIRKGTTIDAFGTTPCGACPVVGLCTPDGVISPSKCVYYTNWLKLNIEF